MSLETMFEEIRALSLDERKRLVDFIIDTFIVDSQSQPATTKRSILEFEGVGAEMWRGIDAQDYVNQLRSEWD